LERIFSAAPERLIGFGQKILFIHPCTSNALNREENIWSVRVSRGYRAVGTLEGDTVTWFWIGGHSDYDRFFS